MWNKVKHCDHGIVMFVMFIYHIYAISLLITMTAGHQKTEIFHFFPSQVFTSQFGQDLVC
jgi:hypothetical protein